MPVEKQFTEMYYFSYKCIKTILHFLHNVALTKDVTILIVPLRLKICRLSDSDKMKSYHKYVMCIKNGNKCIFINVTTIKAPPL